MIQVFDRQKKVIFTEKVYGEKAVSFIYQTSLGKFLSQSVLSKKWPSKLMGRYYSSTKSARLITPFLSEYQIAIDEFEIPRKGFRSFNEFFIREFRESKRPFPENPNQLGAPCEARYLAFEKIKLDTTLKVKNVALNIAQLFEMVPQDEFAKRFDGGICLIARLCPVDYHRFHFFDSGRVLFHKKIDGPLHSVNPVALDHDEKLLMTNLRELSLLKTENFGNIGYLEVGATGVGKIVQFKKSGDSFFRGEQKGYFEFGGSTVVFVFEPGKVQIDQDILENSKKGIECLLRLGESMGVGSRS